MNELENYRKEIEKIDEEMANLFVKRMNVSKKIGEFKKTNKLPIFDGKREEELKLINIKKVDSEYRQSYMQFFELLLKLSKDFQL